MDQLGIEIKKEASTPLPLVECFLAPRFAADLSALHVVGAYSAR